MAAKKRSHYSPRARRYIAREIRTGAREGIEAPRRIARAMTMARQRGLKVPPHPNPAGELREPARDHIRNAMALLMTTQPYTPDGEPLTKADVLMVVTRLRKALLEIEHVDIGLRRMGNRRSVRLGNPALMVLGNPRVVDADIATWAKLEYQRPDDPDGNDVIRVHEFPDGFEIGWLSDGSVQLSHPRHGLWMEDGER